MNIFFGKISTTFNIEQLEKGYYRTTNGKAWFGGIDVGDYAYIIGGGKIQFWKAINWVKENGADRLNFEILSSNLNLVSKQFIALRFFKITKALTVMTSRSAKQAFFKLDILEEHSIEDLQNPEFYTDKNLYRKIVLNSSLQEVKDNSRDIQLYFENDALKLYHHDFIRDVEYQSFKDNLKYENRGCSQKDTVLRMVNESKDFTPREFTYMDLSIRQLYDTFFCEYKEKLKEGDTKDVNLDDLDENSANRLDSVIYPLNQILYGPPGTGKTYNTVLKAAEIIEKREISDYASAQEVFNDNLGNKIEFVTFHQNYSYEDFIQGLRPDTNCGSLSFNKKDGVFKKISDRALEDEDSNYVIIIDEINRANISRVFGELITLIEPDKRSNGSIPMTCTLPSGDCFTVPSNLYIIGTMNTADKSIALLDVALRRRFCFVPMYPKYDIPGIDLYDRDVLEKINAEIILRKGYDFQIGHAYFMGDDNKDCENRMNNKVIPLLLEYFMNDEKEVKDILRKANVELVENSWPLRIKN